MSLTLTKSNKFLLVISLLYFKVGTYGSLFKENPSETNNFPGKIDSFQDKNELRYKCYNYVLEYVLELK